MAGSTIFILLLEVAGLSFDVLYKLISPGKTPWARGAYILSAIFLFVGILLAFPITSNQEKSDTYYAWIPSFCFIAFALCFFILHPLLVFRKR